MHLIGKKSGAFRTLSIVAWAIALGSSAAFANVREVDCSKGETIAKVLKNVQPGDTIRLAGTCSENLLLSSPTGQFNGITLDGQGTATISGPDPNSNVVQLDSVSNFTFHGMTITGGHDGISINTGSSIAIDGVVVQNTGRHGIHFQRGSAMGYVVNSTIKNNPGNGIVVNENSYVRVGFTAAVGASEGDPGPCIVQGNGGFGIRIQRSSSARVYGTTISSNANNGVNIESGSYAEIASDVINFNGKNGVAVSENSTLHLGNPTGTKTEDQPNTTTIPNGQFGLSASWGSYVQGRLGTLSGTSGGSIFTHGANNNLTP